MFNEFYTAMSYQMQIFSENINDQFGQSIIFEIFEPTLQNISALQEMDEYFQMKIIEINQLMDELRAIGELSDD